MKNLKLYEGFAGSALNENVKGQAIKPVVESIYYDLNIMNLLFDEGYLTPEGEADDVSFEDINNFLQEEVGTKDFFDSNESIGAWVINTLINIKDSINKLDL